MGRKTAIGSSAVICLVAAGFFLYSRYIGFERESLANKFPDDTVAYFSIRHLRKAGVAFATDDQLLSSVNVLKAIAKTLSDVSSKNAFEDDTDIDPELLVALGQHFKTQLAFAAFAPLSSESDLPEFALATHFYGSPDDLTTTLTEISIQASNDQLSFRWVEIPWNDLQTYELEFTVHDDSLFLPPIRLTWAVYQEVLYLASNPITLQKLLAFNSSAIPSPSVADSIEKHQIETHLSKPDISFFLNTRKCLEILSSRTQKKLTEAGGFAASFSPSIFIQELGLYEIESFYLASEFTGDRKLYSGIRYAGKTGVLNSFSPGESTQLHRPASMTAYAMESLNLDTGNVLLTLKDAFLKAAPLANIPYFGVRSKVYSSTGFQLEDILATAFAPDVKLLQTLDIGTARSQSGKIAEVVTHDFALKFRLRPKHKLGLIIESQLPTVLANLTPRAYRENDSLYIDSDVDSTITTGRFALNYDQQNLTIGYGTLKSFNTLITQTDTYAVIDSNHPIDPTQIGSGTLSLQSLPTTLFQLATVFYIQVNPDKQVPPEYLQFDWGALSTLEQLRESRTFDDGNGNLYRTSKQID